DVTSQFVQGGVERVDIETRLQRVQRTRPVTKVKTQSSQPPECLHTGFVNVNQRRQRFSGFSLFMPRLIDFSQLHVRISVLRIERKRLAGPLEMSDRLIAVALRLKDRSQFQVGEEVIWSGFQHVQQIVL